MSNQGPLGGNDPSGYFAMREANRQTLLRTPIPDWPEKASGLLSMLFVITLAYAPQDSWITKAILIATFLGAMSCVWSTTGKLRRKVEALCRDHEA